MGSPKASDRVEDVDNVSGEAIVADINDVAALHAFRFDKVIIRATELPLHVVYFTFGGAGDINTIYLKCVIDTLYFIQSLSNVGLLALRL